MFWSMSAWIMYADVIYTHSDQPKPKSIYNPSNMCI